MEVEMKQVKKGLVPRLRFPEFADDGDWEEKKLTDVAKKTASSITLNGLENKTGIYPVYGASGLIAKVLEYASEKEHIGIVKDGSGVGRVMLCPPKSSVIGTLDSIKANDSNSTKFIYYWLIQAPLNLYVIGGAIPHIYFKDYSKIMFGRPSLPEQQKIADCLSSLDELIDAEDKKLEALRLHKKGLMQELFPGEGQTLPKLRFPEFQSAPEWEEKTLGKISNTLQGYGFPEKHQGVTEGIYPFYKVSDISNSLHRGENFIKQAVNYIDETTLKTLKAKLLPVGTTIFAKIGEAIRLNRRVITTVPCLIDNNVAGLKRIEGQATDLFLYYILLRINLAEHCGGAVPSVNKSTIEAIPVICPEPEEQKKIAEFLSSVDNLITSQNQKLESLRLHKKGLMQQLFPNASEVQE
jgi:type I restriction enzyme S subunit